MPVLTNGAEGGTNAAAVTTGNSGAGSGVPWDLVSIGTSATDVYDNTHPAHGGMGYKFATAATATPVYNQWSTAMGTQTQTWFRIYLYFAAVPGSDVRLYQALQGATTCAGLWISNTTRAVRFVNTAAATVITTTTAIPLNQLVRVEGFVIGSATVGQVEIKVFLTADATGADETITSAATQAMTGSTDTYRFGSTSGSANVVAFWMDDIGVSSTGYMGPAIPPRLFMTSRTAVQRSSIY